MCVRLKLFCLLWSETCFLILNFQVMLDLTAHNISKKNHITTNHTLILHRSTIEEIITATSLRTMNMFTKTQPLPNQRSLQTPKLQQVPRTKNILDTSILSTETKQTQPQAQQQTLQKQQQNPTTTKSQNPNNSNQKRRKSMFAFYFFRFFVSFLICGFVFYSVFLHLSPVYSSPFCPSPFTFSF